jgi:hypothetical protein
MPQTLFERMSEIARGGKSLGAQLADAEETAALLRHRIAQATCVEAGSCDMQHVGGKNAGCDKDCTCSVPVHVCSRCGDSDYGDNPEALQIITECAERRA